MSTRRTSAIVLSVALLVLGGAGMTLVSCMTVPPQPAPTLVAPKPIVVQKDFGALTDCPAGTTLPTSDNVCGQQLGPQNLRCVNCGVAVGCLYRSAMVYCAPSCSACQ